MRVLEVGVVMPRGLKRLSSEFICFTRTEAADCMSFDHSVPSSQSMRFARYKLLVTSEDFSSNLGFLAMMLSRSFRTRFHALTPGAASNEPSAEINCFLPCSTRFFFTATLELF